MNTTTTITTITTTPTLEDFEKIKDNDTFWNNMISSFLEQHQLDFDLPLNSTKYDKIKYDTDVKFNKKFIDYVVFNSGLPAQPEFTDRVTGKVYPVSYLNLLFTPKISLFLKIK